MIRDFRNFLSVYRWQNTPPAARALLVASLKYYGFTISFIILHLPIVMLFWFYETIGISTLVQKYSMRLTIARKQFQHDHPSR